MLKKCLGKSALKEPHIQQIVELFSQNYEKYHYNNLLNVNETNELLNSEDFNCVYILSDDKLVGFAGIYLKSEKKATVKEYLLAHLLVDKNERGKGLGNVLEDLRLKMIAQDHEDKIIFASCVEKPMYSMKIKSARNFVVNGFRYKYRNKNDNFENSVVMINSDHIAKKEALIVPDAASVTKKLIQNGNPYVRFKKNNRFIQHKYGIKKVCTFSNRNTYALSSDEESSLDIKEALNQIELSPDRYISVKFPLSINGFSEVDKSLLEAGFLPLCYIPYAKEYYGLIEYQYLPNGIDNIITDDSISIEGKKFLKKIFK